MLSNLITDFSEAHELDMTECPAGAQVNRILFAKKRFKDNPNDAISDFLSYSVPDYTPVQTALSVACFLRNAAAHSISSYQALKGKASGLLQIALNAVFTVIELGEGK
jgi:hypothetical protein